jgi:hypothetical protein
LHVPVSCSVSCINGQDLFVQMLIYYVFIILLFFISISSSKSKRFI